jgi:hypothetical protein
MRLWMTKTDNTAPAAGGKLTAAEDNARGVELNNAVTSAGISLDGSTGPDTDQTMLAQALTRTVSGALLATDSGGANSYILALTASFVAPKALFKSLRVKFYPGNTNSGPSTINAFGLGSKKFLTHTNTAMAGGEVVANREVEADYDPALDGGTGAWRICPWANALQFPIITPTITQVTSGEGVQVETATPYRVNLNYPGLTAAAIDDADLVSFYDQSAVHHRTTTWSALKSLITVLINTYITTAPVEVAPNIGDVFSIPFTSPGVDTGADFAYGSFRIALQSSGTLYLEMSRNAGSTWVSFSPNIVTTGEIGAAANDAYDVYLRPGSVTVSKLGSPGSGALQAVACADGTGNIKFRAVGSGTASGVRTS